VRVLPGDLTFRPSTVDDYRFLADVWTAEYPDTPEDPSLVHHWYRDEDEVWARFLAYAGDRPVGFTLAHHPRWELADDGYVWIETGILPEHRTPANLDALYAFGEARAKEGGGRAGIAEVRADDPLHLAAVAERGYREDRRQRFWELDLVAARGRLEELARLSRERMLKQGVLLTTLAADAHPDKFRQAHAMSTEAEHDVPSTKTIVPPSFERTMEWLDSPAVHQDRVWIARAGDAVAGLSTLEYPVERGIVGTAWTAVGRAHRGRGIARALKLETLLQAIELGVDRVRTDNDSQNAPILHLNEELGYRIVLEVLSLNRPL
jgi:RimJ/RimL family protein N-acetyltransferase